MKYSNIDSTVKQIKKFSINTTCHIKKYSPLLPTLQLTSFPKITKPSELNFFKKIQITEPQHSCILGDLLNPIGSHHQGDLFLKLFFEVLDIEYSKNDLWFVTVEKERFDIRIASKNFKKIIIIENKSNWADDQPNQLYRYWYYGIYLPQKRYKSNECFSKILYLSPSDFKSPSEQTMLRPNDFENYLPKRLRNCQMLWMKN